jgi:RNA polymerase sigma-70 factor (ECF subfamily)
VARGQTAEKGNAGKHAAMLEEERRERLTQLLLRRTRLSEDEAAELLALFPYIFRAHWPAVWGKLRGRALQRAEALDLVQDIFLELHTSMRDEGFPDSIPRMVQGVTQGKLLNHLRSKKREPYSVGLPSSGSEPPRSPVDVDRAIDAGALRAWVLPQLSSEHREALEAVIVHGLSYEEAAEVLGLTFGSFKRRIVEARRRIAELAAQLPRQKNKRPR